MSRDVVVDAVDLVVGYGKRALLPPLTFSLARRELWALVGKNGGGKTTLLRTLLGLLPKVGGAIRQSPGLRIGYVPQRSELDLTIPQRVDDVVAAGLDHGFSFLSPLLPRREESRAKVARALQEVRMDHLRHTPFRALSDGQRQRVLLARALVCDPALLVLDEPTNGMDISSERAAFDLFAELQQRRALALVVVSHHMTLLAERASHAVLVDKDDAVVAAGAIDEMKTTPVFVERYGSVFLRGAAA